MRPELIVASKEFRDHLTSRRFLVIFAILMLICIYSVATGMSQYNENLDEYKKNTQQNQQQEWYKEQVAAYQKQIQDAVANGASQEEIDMLQYQLDMLVNPPMPSALYIFSDLGRYFTLIGMVLSVSMGFDLITREKEDGSLKSLLSHPVYRDAVINGKSMGAIAVLVVVLAATFLITIAIMLFYGMIPALDDFLRIISFFLMALVYCTVFFAFSMMTSTIAKNSSLSVLYVLGIVITLVMISMFSYQFVSFIMGPPPEYNYGIMPVDDLAREKIGVSTGSTASADGNSSDGSTVIAEPVPLPMPPIYEPDGEYQQYWERQQMLTNAINAISPMSNFGDRITPALLYDQSIIMYSSYSPVSSYKMPGMYREKSTVWDALSSIWINILVLIVEIILAFGISYVKFLRVDIR